MSDAREGTSPLSEMPRRQTLLFSSHGGAQLAICAYLSPTFLGTTRFVAVCECHKATVNKATSNRPSASGFLKGDARGTSPLSISQLSGDNPWSPMHCVFCPANRGEHRSPPFKDQSTRRRAFSLHKRKGRTAPGWTAIPGRCVEWTEQAPVPAPESKKQFNKWSPDRGRIRY